MKLIAIHILNSNSSRKNYFFVYSWTHRSKYYPKYQNDTQTAEQEKNNKANIKIRWAYSTKVNPEAK